MSILFSSVALIIIICHYANCNTISTTKFYSGNTHGSHIYKIEWAEGDINGNWHNCKYCTAHDPPKDNDTDTEKDGGIIDIILDFVDENIVLVGAAAGGTVVAVTAVTVIIKKKK